MTVASFGRYALTAQSPQGASLQLVDRMAGPGYAEGVPGEADGRLDLFLDRGTYKLLVEAPEGGRGEVKLAAHPFSERNEPPPRLVELKPVAAGLGDFETRSFWLEVTERRRVALEAAGRYLEDLRLWRDGTWLVDSEPETRVVVPAEGRPLFTCRLDPVLEPGLYLLSAYGGAGQPWAEESDEAPLHLRFGIPRLGEAGRHRHEVSPFGSDRYLLPASANFFRLELPEARPAGLEVVEFDPDAPFREGGARARVSKESLPPAVELELGSLDEGERLVTVTADAGQPYVLQHFQRRWRYGFRRDGAHWISTVHSGPPGDAIDATGLVTRTRSSRRTDPTPFLAQVVPVGSGRGWARRANLLGTLTVYLRVEDTGSYEILSRGVEARFRIEPFLFSRPEKYEPPPFRQAGSEWDLDAGYYVLTVEPEKKGILDVALRPTGLLTFVLDALGAGGVEAEPGAAALTFGAVELDRDDAYVLYLNQQPEVAAGVVLRPLPLDLTEPLPLALRPGEEVEVDFRAAEPGTLSALAEDGGRLLVAVAEGPWQDSVRLPSGRFTARVRNSGEATAIASLELAPEALSAAVPLPPLPEAALASLPEFPVLDARGARFFDLERDASATFRVRADEPALYRLESSGLLATAGNLRSRAITSLDRRQENGVGRNFLIQQYLREGDYQVSVSAVGASRGHLGLALSKTALSDGGVLTAGVPARASLGAGEGLLYRFRIEEEGRYRVQSLGLGRVILARLEDGGGWPIVAPNAPAYFTHTFEPGDYRLLLLPESVPARSLTLLEALPEPPRFDGHGPHPLALDTAVERLWLEPEGDSPRQPDAWTFRLTASAHLQVELPPEMTGELIDGATGTSLGAASRERPWRIEAGAGDLRLELVASRRNNRLPYTVRVAPDELVPGLAREVQVPSTLDVVVGGDPKDGDPGSGELVTLSSFGSVDVRARLLDAAGTVLAEGDDAPGDWNFQITRRLAPGAYRLELESATGPGSTTVALETLRETTAGALRPPEEVPVEVPEGVLLLPLELGREARLVAAGALSPQALGLSLERHTAGGGWETVATAEGADPRLAVGLERGAGAYRLRLWSLDRRPGNARVWAAAPPLTGRPEAQLGAGLRLEEVPAGGADNRLGAALVELPRPGVFHVEASEDLLACTAPGEACSRVEPETGEAGAAGTTVAPTGNLLWLVSGRAGTRVQARRITLPQGGERGLLVSPRGTRPVVVDLEAEASAAGGPSGPALVIATATTGQPGVLLVEREAVAGRPPQEALAEAPRGLATGPAAAVSVALSPRRPAALVWDAGGAGVAPATGRTPATGQALSGQRIDARVRQLRYRAVPAEPASWGPLEGALAGTSARVFELPAGPKRLRIALGADLVAVLSDADRPESVHWLGGSPFEELVSSAAGRLTLLHTGGGAHRYAVEVLPEEPSSGPLFPLERRFPGRGWLRLAVPAEAVAPEALTLRIHGAEGEPLWTGTDGRVLRGEALPVAGGGTLRIPHGPGLVLAWLELDPAAGPGALEEHWFGDAIPEPLALSPPAAVPLAGARVLRLELDEPALVSLRAEVPAISLVRAAGAGAGAARRAPRLGVHEEALALDAYLPAGTSEVWLRGMAGAPLTGTARLTATATTPLGEGLGPEILLAAGDTRLFAFEVRREGPVGLGVRADSDVVTTRLLDADGRELGSGFMQMPELSPGTYLLALTAPRDAPPLRVRPAVVGIDPPGTGPPPDVIRTYLEAAGVRAAGTDDRDSTGQGGAR